MEMLPQQNLPCAQELRDADLEAKVAFFSSFQLVYQAEQDHAGFELPTNTTPVSKPSEPRPTAAQLTLIPPLSESSLPYLGNGTCFYLLFA